MDNCDLNTNNVTMKEIRENQLEENKEYYHMLDQIEEKLLEYLKQFDLFKDINSILIIDREDMKLHKNCYSIFCSEFIDSND